MVAVLSCAVNVCDSLNTAVQLAREYAAETGYRTLDTLHCAWARNLDASGFLSTDGRQLALARLIGLQILEPEKSEQLARTLAPSEPVSGAHIILPSPQPATVPLFPLSPSVKIRKTPQWRCPAKNSFDTGRLQRHKSRTLRKSCAVRKP